MGMANENQVVIVGNLTDDPELRYTPAGAAVANFRVAVNRRTRDESGQWKDGETSFFRVNAWRSLAENVAEVYDLYQKRLYENNAMDFDDLIMQTVALLEIFPDQSEEHPVDPLPVPPVLGYLVVGGFRMLFARGRYALLAASALGGPVDHQYLLEARQMQALSFAVIP
jgi:hypothetical protein